MIIIIKMIKYIIDNDNHYHYCLYMDELNIYLPRLIKFIHIFIYKCITLKDFFYKLQISIKSL